MGGAGEEKSGDRQLVECKLRLKVEASGGTDWSIKVASK